MDRRHRAITVVPSAYRLGEAAYNAHQSMLESPVTPFSVLRGHVQEQWIRIGVGTVSSFGLSPGDELGEITEEIRLHPRRHGQRWTKKEVDEAVRLYVKEKKTMQEIGVLLGRGYEGVKYKLRDVKGGPGPGRRYRKLTMKEARWVRGQYAKGEVSYRLLANHLGVSKSIIRSIIRNQYYREENEDEEKGFESAK